MKMSEYIIQRTVTNNSGSKSVSYLGKIKNDWETLVYYGSITRAKSFFDSTAIDECIHRTRHADSITYIQIPKTSMMNTVNKLASI